MGATRPTKRVVAPPEDVAGYFGYLSWAASLDNPTSSALTQKLLGWHPTHPGLVFDYIITVPGYPRHVEGRKAVAELYRPYGTMIVLDRCHDLAVHHDIKTGVVVLEYASEGRVVSTGAPYTNRYISVLTITDRKVTHWRDYLDPVAVFDALGWPAR